MKLLVSICSYAEHESVYLNKVIESYYEITKADPSIEIDIALCVNYNYLSYLVYTDRIKFHIIRPKYTELAFIYSTNQFIIDNVKNYDLFIHTDSDVVVTYQNIIYYLQNMDFLKEKIPNSYMNYIPGFLVYELDSNNNKRIISMNTDYPPLGDEYLEIARRRYVVPHNLHSNMNMVDSERLLNAISSGRFNSDPTIYKGMYYIREYCMTNIYFDCGMKKVVAPLVPGYLVHHTPNKYITLSDKQITNIELENSTNYTDAETT